MSQEGDSDPIRGGRVLITGGAGLIGSNIADRCVRAQAAEVVIFDTIASNTAKSLELSTPTTKVTALYGDPRNREALAKTVEGIDVVFHQTAVRVSQCADNPRLAVEVMVDGTLNLLEAAVKAKVKKVIVASSAAIYGDADMLPTAERHHPYNNRTLYGACKLFCEQLLRTFYDTYGLDYVALRYYNVYGPRMGTIGADVHIMIRWMERIAEGRPPNIHGDGKETLDFVHVDDVARANVIAARSTITDEAFNIGSGVETSLDDLAKLLLRVMGSPLRPEYLPERKRRNVRRRLAETTKARELLGFEAVIPLEEGLRELVAWWRDQRRWTKRS